MGREYQPRRTGFGLPLEGILSQVTDETKNPGVRSQNNSDGARTTQALAPRVAPANIVFLIEPKANTIF